MIGVQLAGQQHGLAEEAGELGVDGIAIQRLRVGGLDDRAVAHDGDDIGQRQRLLLVVGHQQRRGAALAQHAAHLGAHLRAQAGIEGVEGLVEQHQLGRGRERAGERDALLLAPGELVRAALGQVGQPDQLQQLSHATGVALRTRKSKGDVGGDVEVGEQRSLLRHEADPALLGGDVGALVADDPLADANRAGVGALEAGDQPQQRRLAAARRTEHGREAALRHLELQRVEHGCGTEGLAQRGDRQRRRAHASLRGPVTAPSRRVRR